MGYANVAQNNGAVAIGWNNIANSSPDTNTTPIAIGKNNLSTGNTSLALGESTNAVGANSVAIGKITDAIGEKSIAIGTYTRASSPNSIVIGNGFQDYVYLENNKENSLVVGFESRKATLYVGADSTEGIDNFGDVGIGTTDPQASLEINTELPMTTGLRFTQVTSASPVYPDSANMGAPNGKVLTVDSFGYVILVPDAGGVSACGAGIPTHLSLWSDVNEICNSIIRDDGNRIGVDIDPALSVKMHVENDDQQTGIYILSRRPQTAFTPTATDNIGLFSEARGSQSANTGIAGFVNFDNPNPTLGRTTNIGVYGGAFGTNTTNIGGFFEAGPCDNTNFLGKIGVFARAHGTLITPTLCTPGIAGWFNGQVVVTNNAFTISDTLFKDSIQDISGALATLAELQTKSFTFKNADYPYLGLGVGRHYGLIAQQADSILPEIVETFTHPEIRDSTGSIVQAELDFSAISYSELIPLSISAINSLNELKVASSESTTDSNYVTKWSTTNKNLTNSSIYNTNGKVGIGTTTPATVLDIVPAATNTGYGINGQTVLHNTGTQNIFAGAGAGAANTTGQHNTFMGYNAGKTNLTGSNNTCIGDSAGASLTTTSGNTFIGHYAGKKNTGTENVFIGDFAGQNSTTGAFNIFIGTTAGTNNTSSFNTFIGFRGGLNNAGLRNTSVGYMAGTLNTTGGGNTFFGYNAGSTNIAGDSNTYVGYNVRGTGSNGGSLVNATAIGAYATVTQNNSLVLGSINGLNSAAASTNVGIGTTAPDKKLVINTDNTDTPGESGLRFQDLTTASTPLSSNPFTAPVVLSVDANGNVVLVPDSIGGDVSAGITPTDSNYVPKWSSTNKTLTNSSIYDKAGRVGINTTTPTATLHIDGTADTTGINVTGHMMGILATGDTMGGYLEGQFVGGYGLAAGALPYHAGIAGTSENGLDLNIGVVGHVVCPSDTVKNAGIYGISEGSEFINVGMHGEVFFETETASNYAVEGMAEGSAYENIGGRFLAKDTIGYNVGVYCEADSPGYAIFVQGDVAGTGSDYYLSDRQLKKNVEPLRSMTEQLMRLQPKEYEFKQADYPYINLPGSRQRGLIADEVQQVFPELVRTITIPAQRDTSGKILAAQTDMQGVNYMGLLMPMLKMLQEQQAMIDSLAKALAEVKTSVTNCCGSEIQYRNTDTGENTNEEPHQLTVELSALQIVILEQNAPNPFNEQTTISYFVPEQTTVNGQLTTVSKAQLLFFNAAGVLIKTVDVQKGSGIVTVFAQTLGSGTYSYSLIIDGKVAETKKMVKAR